MTATHAERPLSRQERRGYGWHPAAPVVVVLAVRLAVYPWP